MNVTVITPTGGRPEAFSLCEKYLKRQTVQPHQWIIVDDCIPRTTLTQNQEVIYPEKIWQPGDMTLPANLLLALEKVQADCVLIMEDDDWYSPRYIEKMIEYLAKYDLCGEGHAKYYNVSSYRYIKHTNKKHTSLCQTGFTKKMIPAMVECIENHIQQKFIDMEIWKIECNKMVLPNTNICVGIKGMTGRDGIGYGHKDTKGTKDVIPFRTLKNWIGASDAEVYEKQLWK